MKVDIFRIRRLPKERFLCTLHGCSLQTVVVFMLCGRESSSAFRAERCDSHFKSGQGFSIFRSFSFLISDPGGCFVSNELREWASVRGEFHGLTADLENLIRVFKRLARKLADDHPDLTSASCVSLACFFHTTMFSRLEDTRQFNGHFCLYSVLETIRTSAMRVIHVIVKTEET